MGRNFELKLLLGGFLLKMEICSLTLNRNLAPVSIPASHHPTKASLEFSTRFPGKRLLLKSLATMKYYVRLTCDNS